MAIYQHANVVRITVFTMHNQQVSRMTSKNLDTTLIGAGRSKRYTHGAVNPVTQRASSLVFDSVADKKHATAQRAHGELFYGRRGTLTHFAFQEAMTELEAAPAACSIPAAPRGLQRHFVVRQRRRPRAGDRLGV
ncbi:Cystathionine beta-lyase metC [Serratia rubidaea]|uniref:Cystathionine beta-lyase metC n=1 Tax=Serratia rubidaea TaxID=61652 RepID=A0A3S4FQ93_SERRU|nr:Cystathionine beta-lyase metC [Serratia rubidaea]